MKNIFWRNHKTMKIQNRTIIVKKDHSQALNNIKLGEINIPDMAPLCSSSLQTGLCSSYPRHRFSCIFHSSPCSSPGNANNLSRLWWTFSPTLPRLASHISWLVSTSVSSPLSAWSRSVLTWPRQCHCYSPLLSSQSTTKDKYSRSKYQARNYIIYATYHVT